MENAPTALIPASPPLPLPPPPPSAAQITVLPEPPPPPFPGDPSSAVDLSPLEFLLAVIAVVTVPALICTFIFAFKWPSSRSRQSSSAASEHSSDGADVKRRKEEQVKEMGGECPVCLSAFGDGEEVRQLRACKHWFHASCIDEWLSSHSNCPVCRAATVERSNSLSPNRDRHHHDASALV